MESSKLIWQRWVEVANVLSHVTENVRGKQGQMIVVVERGSW
jgi:hypothetical protein